VVALTFGGFISLVYQPLLQKQAAHESRTQQLDLLVEQTGAAGSNYRALRSRLETMQESLTELHRQLAGHPTESEAIGEIGDIATQVGLEVLDYQIGLTESCLTYSQTEVELRCHGSYTSICRFLEKIEHLTKVTKLSKFELNSAKNSHGYPIQLTFVLYSEGQSHDTKEKRGDL